MQSSEPRGRVSLPKETLHEIYDMLVLALDATAAPHPSHTYPQHMREARSYLRIARRRTLGLMAEGV